MHFKSIRSIFTLWLYTGVFLILLPVFLPSAPRSAERPSQNRIVARKVEDVTVYVWDSQPLLDRSKIDLMFWKQFHPHGINRLLLSLDGQQIEGLVFQENKSDLLNFIARANEKDIRVELLLGEPLWILPKYRRDLLWIIQKLEDIPFTGLHLDLEPNQLDQARHDNKYLLTQLVHTLQSVKWVSPWPVGLSIHPRYLDPQKNQLCLGCALSNLEINEVILMVYVANPARVAQLALPILSRFPELSFSIAQSVEPFLSVEESYAMRGRKQFRIRMRELRAAMVPEANFTTIAIQSWEDFLRLKP